MPRQAKPATVEERLDAQDALLDQIAAQAARNGETLTILSHQLGEVIRLLTPAPIEGESSLERLLAQLVSQGTEQIKLLKTHSAMLQRIEGRHGEGIPEIPKPNGHARA